MSRPLVLLLTFVTGFTGLAYEVTWQKYLAILLGAHSEATAAVLGLFLGGLALGYWIFGIVTRRLVERGVRLGRPAPLLLVYGAVEAGIGLYCALFPATFGAVRSLSLLLPTDAGALGFAVDVGLAALLILPPATLMGGTIPILTQTLARSLEDATRLHAFVYAFNTAGAFLGALAAGFALIHWLGLDGVMLQLGAVNIGVGALLALLGLRRSELAQPRPQTRPSGPFARPTLYEGVALLIGFAMMVFQTVLIRVAGLSFGSSEYTFSMVVAVFVLCIALGSVGVSLLPRVGRALLPAAVWGLAALAALLYPALEKAPYWPYALRTLFRDQEAGFPLYCFTAFVGLGLVIGPTVVVSGATLPLLFHALKREQGDLGACAGRLYSLNTVGALAGALIGGYALFFWLDLHQVYRIGVAVLVLAAAVVTLLHHPRLGRVGAAALVLVPLLGIASLPGWDPRWLSSGLFRDRQPEPLTYRGPSAIVHDRASISFHDDDPNTSVVVQDWGAGRRLSRTLVVNGKSEGNTRSDYDTTTLLGLLPALFADRVEDAFVIGFGTGISAGALAALDHVERVTIAEISPAVADAVPLFDFANRGVSRHPKVRIVRSDAYRALLKGGRDYDVIVSEPSNPWMTGVEMLYAREFLEEARDRLSPDGVYSQWLHLYETNPELIGLVLATFASVFDHIAVWSVNHLDVIVLGFRDAERASDLDRLEERFWRADFRDQLAWMGVDSVEELLAHETLPTGVVNAASFDAPVHTLYRPRLNALASRAFFVGEGGNLPFLAYGEPAEVGARRSLLNRWIDRHDEESRSGIGERVLRRTCRSKLPSCPVLLARWLRAHPGEPVPDEILGLPGSEAAVDAARQLEGLLAPDSGGPWRRIDPRTALEWTRSYLTSSTPVHPLDPAPLLRVWKRCGGGPEVEAECARGLQLARRLVQGEPVPDASPKEWLALGTSAEALRVEPSSAEDRPRG